MAETQKRCGVIRRSAQAVPLMSMIPRTANSLDEALMPMICKIGRVDVRNDELPM